MYPSIEDERNQVTIKAHSITGSLAYCLQNHSKFILWIVALLLADALWTLAAAVNLPVAADQLPVLVADLLPVPLPVPGSLPVPVVDRTQSLPAVVVVVKSQLRL